MLPVWSIAQNSENTNKWSVGAAYVHRFLEYYDDYSYPRLSAEYSFTKCSSAEILFERVGKIKSTSHTYPANYPISVGYKLNVLPWFTKNKWLVNNLKIYNSLRYSIIFGEDSISQKVRYAPGIECYVYKNLALSSEFTFGQAMKTTLAIGVKYRF